MTGESAEAGGDERTVPVIEPPAEEYWAGARRQELVIQRCADCSYWIHPPKWVCPSCQSFDLRGEVASGRGTLYAWSVNRMKGVPGFPPPYAVVTVELAEQPGLITVGNLRGTDPGDLRIGLPVAVEFEVLNDDVVLPQWRVGAS